MKRSHCCLALGLLLLGIGSLAAENKLPVETADVRQKIEKLFQDVETTEKRWTTIVEKARSEKRDTSREEYEIFKNGVREIFNKYQRALTISPTSIYLFEIHEKIYDELEGVHPTEEAIKKMQPDIVKLLKQSGDPHDFEKIGLEEMLRKCDEVIASPRSQNNEVLTAMVTKGYIYLTDKYGGYSQKSVLNGIRVFEEIIKKDKPEWVLNGLIGLAHARGLYALRMDSSSYEYPVAEEKEKVYRKIIDQYPGTIFAIMAQNCIIGAYADRDKLEKARGEAEKLLKYSDQEIVCLSTHSSHLGDLVLQNGKNKLHAQAKWLIQSYQEAINKKLQEKQKKP